MSKTPHQKAFDKAKVRLLEREDSLFYTSVFFSLNHIWTDEIPTACTDGKSVKFNPDYFMNCSPDEQLGLILHETEHVTFKHMTRRGDRDPRKWNWAADFVIDTGLIDRGFKVPDPCYHEGFRGMSTPQVYDLLPDPPDSYQPDVVDASSSDGDNGSESSSGERTKLEEEINDILVRAAMHVKMAGKDAGLIPGEIRVYLDQLLNPQLPWQVLLRRYCNRLIKRDYTFKKPNRRYFPDMLLPSRSGEGIEQIAAILDMSGSVTNQQSLHFASEAFAIFKSLRPSVMNLVQFDTQIKSVTPIKYASDMSKVTYHGRGGTLIQPVIEWIGKNKPTVAVIFTDGEFTNNMPDPKVPIIWVIHGQGSFDPAYGKVVRYKFT